MSTSRTLMFWINLLGYQATWFIAVIGAAHGIAWPALAAGSVFVITQIATARAPSVEFRLLIVAIVFGIVIDGVAARMEWLRYAAPLPSLPGHGAPLWILTLWGSFAMTINRSLVYVRDRYWLALVFGAIGAPLAYLSAQRGWHAVVFQPPLWHGLSWLAASWAIALPLLAMMARRLSSTSRGPLPAPEDATR